MMNEGTPCLGTDDPQYATHFKCSLDPDLKQKITPWTLEKTVHHQLGSKPKSIRSVDRDSFIIEVNSKEQSRDIITINKVCEIPVTITQDKT